MSVWGPALCSGHLCGDVPCLWIAGTYCLPSRNLHMVIVGHCLLLSTPLEYLPSFLAALAHPLASLAPWDAVPSPLCSLQLWSILWQACQLSTWHLHCVGGKKDITFVI